MSSVCRCTRGVWGVYVYHRVHECFVGCTGVCLYTRVSVHVCVLAVTGVCIVVNMRVLWHLMEPVMLRACWGLPVQAELLGSAEEDCLPTRKPFPPLSAFSLSLRSYTLSSAAFSPSLITHIGEGLPSAPLRPPHAFS